MSIKFLKDLPIYPNDNIKTQEVTIYSDRLECRPDMVDHVREMIQYFLGDQN